MVTTLQPCFNVDGRLLTCVQDTHNVNDSVHNVNSIVFFEVATVLCSNIGHLQSLPTPDKDSDYIY